MRSLSRPKPDTVIQHSGFRIDSPRGDETLHALWAGFNSTSHYYIGCTSFENHALQWTYVLERIHDLQVLGTPGQRNTLAQLFKLPAKKRRKVLGGDEPQETWLHEEIIDKPVDW